MESPRKVPEIIRTAIEEMKAYIAKYGEENLTENNAPDGIREFKEDWIETSSFFRVPDPKPAQLCGQSLIIYTCLLIQYEARSLDQVNLAEAYAQKFKGLVKHMDGTNYAIYNNIACAWIDMGGEYEDKALESFKRAIYYLLRSGFEIGYRPTAYKFTRCSDRLFDYLRKEQIPLTPPREFNDPFDCPICDFLNPNEKAVQLAKKAYDACISVACFIQNEMLPSLGTPAVRYKSGGPQEDYRDELMWAHYANSHRGICIKYNLSSCKDIHGEDDNDVYTFMRDVRYSSDALEGYSLGKRNSMPISDFFFLKGDAWKYEKEVRLVQFNLRGKGERTSISAPGCIEAIYFGLNCSLEDRKVIRDILANKTFVRSDSESCSEDSRSQIARSDSEIAFTRQSGAQSSWIKKEVPILFYEMEKDPEHFGRVRVKKSVSLL